MPEQIPDQYYKDFLLNMAEGFCVTDMAGNFLAVNDAFCKLLSYPREALLGMRYQQLEVEEKPETIESQIKVVLDKGANIFFAKHRRYDGSVIEMQVCSTYDKNNNLLFALMRDVTEQRESERQLMLRADELRNINQELKEAQSAMSDLIQDSRNLEKKIEERSSLLQATLDSTVDGILVVDINGKITNFNQRFVKMWSIPEAILTAVDFNKAFEFVLIKLKDPETFTNKAKETMSKPDAESYDVVEFNDGRVFERYSRPELINSKSVGRVWSFLDITERRQAEERNTKQLQELERINKLMIGRELKMAELKKQIRALQENTGELNNQKIINK